MRRVGLGLKTPVRAYFQGCEGSELRPLIRKTDTLNVDIIPSSTWLVGVEKGLLVKLPLKPFYAENCRRLKRLGFRFS